MKFSVWMQPLHHPDDNPTLALEYNLELIEHLDKLGFDAAWIGEHHSTGWEPIGSPDVFMAAAFERTSNIKLGAGIIQLSLHHPMHAISRIILLDHLSKGRAYFGIGVGGGLPTDFHVFGLKREEAGKRFGEALDTILKLLENKNPVSVETDWFKLKDAILQLQPYGDLPFIMATGNPLNLEFLGSVGGYLLTGGTPEYIDKVFGHMEDGANKAGKIASRKQIILVKSMYLAETKEQAMQNIRGSVLREKEGFMQDLFGMNFEIDDPEEWLTDYLNKGIVGTPNDAIEALTQIQNDYGEIGGMAFVSKDWGDRNAIKKSYELFARHVMHKFTKPRDNLLEAAKVATQIRISKGK